MNELLNRQIRVVTHGGKVVGKVVGHEQKDTTRSGSGDTTPFLCVHRVDSDFWQWLPMSCVQFGDTDGAELES